MEIFSILAEKVLPRDIIWFLIFVAMLFIIQALLRQFGKTSKTFSEMHTDLTAQVSKNTIAVNRHTSLLSLMIKEAIKHETD